MDDVTDPVTPYAGGLPLVMALAAVAGFLDAISLARITHTFVAFQTGNLVLVGVGIGRGEWSDAALPAVAVIAYVSGSALVPMVLRRGSQLRRTVVLRLLGTTVALLLIETVVVAIASGAGGDAPAPGRSLRYACTVLSGVAMAFQTPVVRAVDGIAVSSTFSTGMLTRLGQALGSLADVARRPHESMVLRVLGGTVCAFLVGATVGGALLEPIGNATLFVPIVALVLITIATWRAATD